MPRNGVPMHPKLARNAALRPPARTEKLNRLLKVHVELVHRAPVQLALHRAQSDPSKWPILNRPLARIFHTPNETTSQAVRWIGGILAAGGEQTATGMSPIREMSELVAYFDRPLTAQVRNRLLDCPMPIPQRQIAEGASCPFYFLGCGRSFPNLSKTRNALVLSSPFNNSLGLFQNSKERLGAKLLSFGARLLRHRV